MENIQAAGALKQFLDKLTDSFFKGLSDIFKSSDTKISYEKGKIIVSYKSVDMTKEELEEQNLKVTDGVFDMVVTLNWDPETPLTRKAATEIAKDNKNWAESKDGITVEMQYNKSKKYKKDGLSGEDVGSELEKYIQKIEEPITRRTLTRIFLFEESDGSDTSVDSSRRLQVTLQKVVGGTETSINMTKINANYNLDDALNDVSAIVQDDEFVAQLPDNEEISYDIVSDETDYDVNECDADYSCNDSIQQMIQSTLQLSIDTKLIVATATGECYEILRLVSESLSYELDRIVQLLADALFDTTCEEIQGTTFSFRNIRFDEENQIEDLCTKINTYIECLDAITSCVSPGIESDIKNAIGRIESAVRDAKRRV